MGVMTLLLITGLVGGGAFYYFQDAKKQGLSHRAITISTSMITAMIRTKYGYKQNEEEQTAYVPESEDDVK